MLSTNIFFYTYTELEVFLLNSYHFYELSQILLKDTLLFLFVLLLVHTLGHLHT